MAPSETTRTPSAPSAKQARSALVSAIGIAIVLAVFWTVIGGNVVPAARGHDFLNLYVGGTLAASGQFAEIYDQDVQLQLEQQLVPTTEELVPFVRPHFYALLLSPLALFSLDTALWLWIGLHAAVLVGCWTWAARRFGPDALVLGALYLPTPLGIAHGQDGVFMAAIVIAAYMLASKGRDQAAGAVAALALMKFHITFLIPVGMIIQKRWRMLGAYCATAAGLVAVSALTGGWTGMLSYVHLLQAKDLRRLSPSPDLMVNIHSITANFGIDQPVISAGLIALVVAIMFVAVRRAPLWRFWSAILIGSVLVGPHVFGYDAAMLLLAVWLVVSHAESRPSRVLAAIVAVPLLFFCSLLDTPWPVVPSLVLLAWLSALAWENRADLTEHMGVA